MLESGDTKDGDKGDYINSSKIPKFSSENYNGWCLKIQAAFAQKKILHTIQKSSKGKAPTKEEKLLASSYLINSLDYTELNLVTSKVASNADEVADPLEIQETLKRYNMSNAATNAFQLLRQYFHYKKKPEDNMKTHLGRMGALAVALETVTEKLSPRQQIMAILDSLPEE